MKRPDKEIIIDFDIVLSMIRYTYDFPIESIYQVEVNYEEERIWVQFEFYNGRKMDKNNINIGLNDYLSITRKRKINQLLNGKR